MTGMTGVIKGWPFAAGMVHPLLPAAPDCLSDLGLKARVFVWQIMANLSAASVPLVAPSLFYFILAFSFTFIIFFGSKASSLLLSLFPVQ